MSLAIVCPTRERVEPCRRMIVSALETTSADLLLYVDSDDRSNYKSLAQDRVTIHVGTPQGRGKAVNSLCDLYRQYRMYLIVSDDITFVRKDWDLEVEAAMDAFGDDIGLVHLESENHETYVNWACVSRRWLDALGWFNYPDCTWFCQDTILQVLAEALGRIAFIQPEVVAHHIINHPDMPTRLAHDQDKFLWYMARDFGSDLARLRAAIKAAA